MAESHVNGDLRISGGQWRGRKIKTAAETRPTKERVREALMARWQMDVEDSVMLELFCGSGAVALEFLSRGAKHAFAVDRNIETAQRNAKDLETAELDLLAATLPDALARLPPRWPTSYDFVFADPPYDFGSWASLLAGISSFMATDTELALEHSTRVKVPHNSVTPGRPLEMVDCRQYGESTISFYRCQESPG